MFLTSLLPCIECMKLNLVRRSHNKLCVHHLFCRLAISSRSPTTLKKHLPIETIQPPLVISRFRLASCRSSREGERERKENLNCGSEEQALCVFRLSFHCKRREYLAAKFLKTQIYHIIFVFLLPFWKIIKNFAHERARLEIAHSSLC